MEQLIVLQNTGLGIGGHGGDNTGGGGGGDGQTVNLPGNGGSGVVIIRMKTIDYSSSTGSPTVTTSGDDTILTYTSSGTLTTAA